MMSGGSLIFKRILHFLVLPCKHNSSSYTENRCIHVIVYKNVSLMEQIHGDNGIFFLCRRLDCSSINDCFLFLTDMLSFVYYFKYIQ